MATHDARSGQSATGTGHHAVKLEGIQAARLFAALLVVVTHATFYVASRMGTGAVWRNGGQGVELFFVISGFVMMVSATPMRGTPGAVRSFAAARLIRIVPLYWTLNLVKIVQVALVPAVAFARPDVPNILLSMAFIPSRNANGIVETFYGVGWTLNFEMFFYALVGLALAMRRSILWVATPVLLLAFGLSFLRTEAWPAITSLCHPIVLNFLWGMVIGRLYLAHRTVPPVPAIVAIAAGIIVILVWPDNLLLGLPYALVIGGAVALEPWLHGHVPRWLIFGGDASYSLYLVHPMIGVAVAVILHRLHVASFGAAVSIVVASALVAAALLYRYFEQPVTRRLQRMYRARQMPEQSAR